MEHHGDDVCWGSCVDAWQNSHTIPTVGNLWSRSFSFPPKSFLLPPELIRTQIVVKPLNQNMAQKEPEKKMPLTAANGIIRTVKLALVGLHYLRAKLALR